MPQPPDTQIGYGCRTSHTVELIAVWKIVLNPSSMTKLTPSTEINLPDLKTIGKTAAKESKSVERKKVGDGNGS